MTNLSHPSDVLTALLALSNTRGRGRAQALAGIIDACGAYVSPPGKRDIGDRQETVHWLDSCAFAVPDGLDRVLTWPEPPPDGLRGPLEFVRWASGYEHLSCAYCGAPTGAPVAANSRAPKMVPRNIVPLCRGAHDLTGEPKFVALGEVSPQPGELPWLDDAGDRLRKMVGLSHDEFYQQVLPLNILPSPLAIRPSRVPRKLFLRLHGLTIEPILLGAQIPIVAFGRAALEALEDLIPRGDFMGFPAFDWHGLAVHSLPHPSGRSRTYNDTTTREQAATLLAHLLQ